MVACYIARLSFKQEIKAYRMLAVIRAALIYIRSKTNRRVCYKQDVDSHRVTLDCMIRDGLKKGVRYKQDVCISSRISQ